MRNLRVVTLAVALVALLAACGGSSAEEELMDQLLESSGGDVSNIEVGGSGDDFGMTIEGENGATINISGSGQGDDFDVTVEGDDGSASFSGNSEDGTITIEGEDGETMTIGGGEIPASLQIPVPDGGEVVSTIESGSDVTVTVVYPVVSHDAIVAFYDNTLHAGSDEVTRTESTFSSDDGDIHSVSWTESSSSSWTVALGTCYGVTSGMLDSTCLTIYQTQ